MELQFVFFDEDDQFFSKDPDRTDTDDFVLTNNQIKSFYREVNELNTIIIETLADDPDEFLKRSKRDIDKDPLEPKDPKVYVYSDASITEKKQKLVVFPIEIKNKGRTIFEK